MQEKMRKIRFSLCIFNTLTNNYKIFPDFIKKTVAAYDDLWYDTNV